jgi:hypothetical protein
VRIKLIDLDEFPLVVMVRADGTATVSAPTICDGAAADLLRSIAADLDALHPPFACSPGDTPAPQPEADETLGKGGALDTDRKVWTDGTGHAWDLSVTWGSAGNLRWWWTGGHTEAGVPLMRTGDGTDEQPLDLVWALYGPLFPTAGDRA